ncbi:MAG TPA: DUF2520 domain-containing protein [Acidimicrobiales bacterium]
MTTVRIIGPGRAGTSLALALTNAGCDVAPMLGRDDDVTGAAHGVELLVIATPDAVIADVARTVDPDPATVVLHLAGSLGLDVLEPHPRRAALHPLVALPNPDVGARRLVGAWFAVTGDPAVRRLVDAMFGRAIRVADEHRAAYHAAASIAANHLVALMGQVQRVGAAAGVPFEAYLDLARAALDNVADLGPAAALTGPVARGDDATVRRHLDALPPDERPAYEAMADAARRLARERPASPPVPPPPLVAPHGPPAPPEPPVMPAASTLDGPGGSELAAEQPDAEAPDDEQPEAPDAEQPGAGNDDGNDDEAAADATPAAERTVEEQP